MDYYQDNTTARYTTKLPNVVEVDGDWEVGLTEISIPARIENECYFELFTRDEFVANSVTHTSVPKHYHRIFGVKSAQLVVQIVNNEVFGDIFS